MTTHETQPATMDTTARLNRGAAPSSEPVEQAREPQNLAESTSAAGPAHAAGSSDQTLFGDGELSGFHARWTEVQAAFVDDPRDCVQKADGLVSDVVDRLTAGFAQARAGLEEQWSRGEQVSTEDLRLALQRYRDFFERLLAI
ncbi:hypothetical protein [Mycobacterium sp. ITM-2016-00318]|uniref:hypothetical protein n=1 Tax=Mycobacterium sp. ITM-2016-00318 TaxID=2099693 RepID=UPI000CF9BFCB|nr:hypothetical protein [Mycobacterium sp. ITM-2016-00318]WNG93287.1 hypothetical protein C6A82_002020 [Mycobacterium sp. ITM-2016-00318]